MRTLKISLLVFILSITISAQWYQQNSGTGQSFYAVSFVDADHGWAVGQPAEQGTILMTSDGGLNWIPQVNNSGTGVLLDVKFIDLNNGWISGQYGKILRTTNGGLLWYSQATGTNSDLYGITFIDLNNGWAVGQYDKILHTTNGGINWYSQSSGTTSNFDGVYFINSNTGWVVGDYGAILKTTDSGQTWVDQSIGSWPFHSDIYFVDELNGWIVGEFILRTTNGGETWITQLYQPNVLYIGISFINSNIGWVVGSQGRILITTNGGQNWIEQTSWQYHWLRDVCFVDSLVGTAVGDFGTIVRTVNGGIPVELTSFTANILANEVELNWSTATETNNQGFEILRFTQKDKDKWNKIGFVPGHGTTTETHQYSFTDSDIMLGKYQYKLKQIDYDGTFEYSQIVEVEVPFVNEFSLSQNYPNPFNPSTSLQYAIGSRQFVTLNVYDLLGREVATLVNEEKPAGEYEVEFDGSNLPSGIYFYQLIAGSFVETKKMVLMK